jgi:adenylylsulfate kinase
MKNTLAGYKRLPSQVLLYRTWDTELAEVVRMRISTGKLVWLTGLSGAGKSTLCRSIERELIAKHQRVQVLDGDVVRRDLCSDLGYTEYDRFENIRRIAHVAKLLVEHEVIVLVAAITPLTVMRDFARGLCPQFIEVFVDASLDVCEFRDTKGLYRLAREGKISDFTGISSPYERPTRPEVICYTAVETIEESTEKILHYLYGESIADSSTEVPVPRRLSIAVDFDGVIANYFGWKGRAELGAPRSDVILALRQLSQQGWKIIVHTTRCEDDIREYLVRHSIPFDEVNQNSDYNNYGTKPVATVYWDDRAVRYSGDALNDLPSILAFTTWSGRS